MPTTQRLGCHRPQRGGREAGSSGQIAQLVHAPSGEIVCLAHRPGWRHGPGRYLAAMVAGVIELVIGLLVLVGLLTRITALIGSGEMAFAYFAEHQPKGLLPIENGGELAVLYCFALVLIAFVGAEPLPCRAIAFAPAAEPYTHSSSAPSVSPTAPMVA